MVGEMTGNQLKLGGRVFPGIPCLFSLLEFQIKDAPNEYFLALDFKLHLVGRHDLRVKYSEFYDNKFSMKL